MGELYRNVERKGGKSKHRKKERNVDRKKVAGTRK